MTWLKRFDSRHPLLNMFAYFSAFTRSSLGSENKNLLLTSQNNKVTFYRSEEENEQLKELWKNKFLDFKYMSNRFDLIRKTIRDSDIFIERLKSLKFENLSNIELNGLYREYLDIFTKIFIGYNLSQPEVPAVAEEELQKLIYNKIKDKSQAIKLYAILTSPTKTNLLEQEEHDWLNVLLKIKQEGLTQNTLKLIRAHSDTFGWISTQENLPFLNANYFIKLAEENQDSEKAISSRIYEIKQRHIKTIQKIKKILRKLKDEKIAQYSAILREAGHLRINLRLAWTKMAYFAKPLLDEISSRIGLNHEEVRYLFPYEVEEDLIKGKIANKKMADERMKSYVMIMKDGLLQLYIKKKAEEIKNKLVKKDYSGITELSGTIANPGLARGTVKVIYSHVDDQLKEVEKMKRGDILVAGSTKPQLIVACRKAAAIVTDEGGITSHAAIVSREFGIPCIVGTKYATQIFKDGDYIEVDANKGIVKKINK